MATGWKAHRRTRHRWRRGPSRCRQCRRRTPHRHRHCRAREGGAARQLQRQFVSNRHRVRGTAYVRNWTQRREQQTISGWLLAIHNDEHGLQTCKVSDFCNEQGNVCRSPCSKNVCRLGLLGKTRINTVAGRGCCTYRSNIASGGAHGCSRRCSCCSRRRGRLRSLCRG